MATFSNSEESLSEIHGYSIWLTPSESERAQFQTFIKRFSEVQKTPIFEPHVTLLGQIPTNAYEKGMGQFEKVAVSLKNLPLILTDVSTSFSFFRALYFEIELSKELQCCWHAAASIFNYNVSKQYKPHMALAYGVFRPKGLQRMKAMVDIKLPRTVTVKKIKIMKTEGFVKDWIEIVCLDVENE